MSELLARISARELAEWQAYFTIGAERLVLEDLKRTAVERLAARDDERRRRRR